MLAPTPRVRILSLTVVILLGRFYSLNEKKRTCEFGQGTRSLFMLPAYDTSSPCICRTVKSDARDDLGEANTEKALLHYPRHEMYQYLEPCLHTLAWWRYPLLSYKDGGSPNIFPGNRPFFAPTLLVIQHSSVCCHCQLFVISAVDAIRLRIMKQYLDPTGSITV